MSLVLVLSVSILGQPPSANCANLPDGAEAASRLSAMFDYDRPKESETALLQFSDVALTCGDKELAAASLAQAARAQGIDGRNQDARATLARAATLALRPSTKLKIQLEQGRIARRQRNIAEARALLNDVFRKSLETKEDALAADAAHVLALLEDGASSAMWTDRGLVIAENSSDPVARRWVGNLAYNAGVRLSESGDHAAAALMYARSLAARRIENDAELVAAAELALSSELAELGLVEQAQAIQDRLIGGSKDAEFTAQVRTAIARTTELKAKSKRR